MKKLRNPSVELYRCILMLLIVLWHSYDLGIYGRGVDSGLWSIFFAFTFWHVDGFMAISGWYGIKFKWQKFFNLWGLIFFCSVLIWIAGRLAGNPGPFSVSGGWYGGSYMLLMFFAPALNVFLKSAVRRSKRFLLVNWGLMAIGMTLAWMPFLSKYIGVSPLGGGGWSFLTMMFVYVTARTFKLLELSWSRKLLVAIATFFVGSVAFWGGSSYILRIITGQPTWGYVFGAFSTYDAPHMWLFAIAVLVLFEQKIRVPFWIGRIATWAAPSMFAVFLLHHNDVASNFFFKNGQEWIKNTWDLHPFVSILITGLITFILCVMIDATRRALIGIVYPLFAGRIGALDALWERWTHE